MKNQLISLPALLISGTLILGFTSCKKESSDIVSPTSEVSSAQSFNLAETEDNNVQIMADQAQSEGNVNLRMQPVDNSSVDLITSCAVITRDTASTPKKITIDFGTGCPNAHGDIRKGKIITTYTGKYRDAGTVIHITTENYYVNSNKIDINKTVTNNGLNDNGNYTFSIHSVRTVLYTDGTTSTSTADKTREWIAGASTPHDFTDDVFRVTGTASHISRTGVVYDATTITPLIRKVDCHQFVSGDVKIVRHALKTRYCVIDYGTGECDDTATVTLDNGKAYTIDLKLH